jgi:hypothetical protein
MALDRKLKIIPRLALNDAPIAEIDAAQPLEVVVAAATAAVTRRLTEHGYQRSEPWALPSGATRQCSFTMDCS